MRDLVVRWPREQEPMSKVTEDFIEIKDAYGSVVYWDKTEWLEEPELAVTIANSLRIAYEQSTFAVRELIENWENVPDWVQREWFGEG